ncbi:MAG: hypothetical protein ACREKB_05520 [Candidatus Rokuibacteriota bacterium]
MAAATPEAAAPASRLDTILMTAESLLRSPPANGIAAASPARAQSLRELGFRIFRLGLAFIDAVDAGQLREAWLQERLPADMRQSRTVANYGALVRGRLAGWFEGTDAATFTRTIDTQDGPRLAHELLEHMIEQAAQHLRDLRALAERDQGAGGPAGP